MLNKKKPPIPIIILNWNGIDNTLECMDTIFKMNFTNYKVYLVDNASKDESQKILLQHYENHAKVQLIFNEENLGFTRGSNAIIRQILVQPNMPEYIVLLNNDTAVTPNWLGNLLNSAITKKAAMVSSKMVDYYERDKMDNAGHLMLNTGEILPIGHGESIENYTHGFENMGACAGAALYATNMLKDIGVFDEHFNTGYEDAELGIRAVLCGYKCWYEPTAIVYHKMGQSIKKIFDYEYSLTIHKHIWYSYIKLMPTKGILVTLPSFAFKYTAMLLINLLFWRSVFMKIMFQSLKGALWDEINIALQSRKDFHLKKQISTYSLLRKQNFFLWIDLKRFYKYFILNQHSALDVYGKIEKT